MATRHEPTHPTDAADAVNPDLTAAVGSEDLDQDRLDQDPLEEGMDPPEDWSGADRQGITAREQEEGESLEHRIEAERPDIDSSAAADHRDRDAYPSTSDVPTAPSRLEHEDDPGEQYR